MLATDWVFIGSVFVDFAIAIAVFYVILYQDVYNRYKNIAIFAGLSSLILGLHHSMEIIEDAAYFLGTISEFLELMSVVVLLITILRARKATQEEAKQ